MNGKFFHTGTTESVENERGKFITTENTSQLSPLCLNYTLRLEIFLVFSHVYEMNEILSSSHGDVQILEKNQIALRFLRFDFGAIIFYCVLNSSYGWKNFIFTF